MYFLLEVALGLIDLGDVLDIRNIPAFIPVSLLPKPLSCMASSGIGSDETAQREPHNAFSAINTSQS
jgi:hypothetical protein